jgi:small-conductance mechanosensitive channel
MRVQALFAMTLCSLLFGQDNGAPVVVDGREVVRVYGPIGSFNASDRAPEIEARIVALSKRGFAGKIETRAIPSENATAVVAGPAIIMAVTDVDAQAVGIPRDELAQRYSTAIQKAIGEYHAAHSWIHILYAGAKTLVAWIVFSITAWGLWKLIQRLSVRLDTWFSRQSEVRETRRIQVLVWERGRLALLNIVRLGVFFILLFTFSFLVSFTFGLFPQTASISTTLMEHLGRAFGRVGTASVRYLPSGGFVVIVAALTNYVLRLLKFLAQAIEHREIAIKSLHPEMAKPTYQLVRLVVVLFALVVSFPYLPGGNSDALKGVSIFLGILLSLGSSSAVSNVLAGLVLTYMRPFRIGDRVKIADTVGDVLEKTLLVTRVRTIKNVEVVIPNSAILSNQILDYSALARTQGLILNTSVTIGYDAPWRKVHELLIGAALRTDGVLSKPDPFVLQTSLNDFHISYELNAYTDRANEIHNIYSHIHEAIQDSFNQAGVEIMSPTFYALRDGNTVTIPQDHRPADYEAPSFRVKTAACPPVSTPSTGRNGL